MFSNINGWELLIIGIVAVLVIGPKRLPEYVQKFRNFVKEARRMANGARDQFQDDSGIDLSDVDWRKLDPRQYDPRRIIRQALLEDEPATKPVSGNPAAAALAAQSSMQAPEPPEAGAAETSSPGADSPGSGAPGAAPGSGMQRLAPGKPAPWDNEAT